jgi:hypothetical protein
MEEAAMRATEALRAARALGVELAIDGNDLLLEAASEPPAVVLDELSRHKAEIVALLRGGRDSWSAEDWLLFFEERAAIAEFDAGLSRAEAEAQALACCIVEWLNQHPAPSAPGRCAWCGKAESRSAVVLPFGTEPGTHTWLHTECWSNWHRARKTDAIAALGAMGIEAATIVTGGDTTSDEAREFAHRDQQKKLK